ncbi:MAG TPA: VCBS repeat-containing protein [Pyrinomonadaceae bacterium]
MSKKKRSNQRKSNEPISLGLSGAHSGQSTGNTVIDSSNPSQSDESSLTNKTGVLSYIKNSSNWWVIAIVVFFAIGAMGAGLKYLDESAKKERAANRNASSSQQNQSLLSKLNPFANPTPTPTPLPLSKEYIYAGSRLLAVEDANANAAPPADLAVWRPSSGYWYVMGVTQQQWGSGSSNDKPVPGDYDGDGKTDFAIYRPTTGAGIWCVIKSSTGADEYYNFGTSGDVPKAADFDGDGKSDAALFRPSNGTWYIRYSTTGNLVTQQFGTNGDVPVPADFDGDGKADIAVFRPGTSGYFYIFRSSDGQLQSAQFGLSGDEPHPADYDGDGKADFAVWRTSNGNWHINQSSNNTTVSYQWGVYTQDTAVPNDYDGDGKVDVAVWRGSSSNSNEIGSWYIRNSSTGQMRTESWGQTGDTPVPALYRR